MPMPVKTTRTEIPDVLVVECGIVRDERGSFSESHSVPMFSAAGLSETFVQDNLSVSHKGTVRGLHYQLAAGGCGMGKLVRAVRGSVFDVAVDLRRGSPTFGKWVGRTLSAENGLALWVPIGFAHGFLSLEDDTVVLYKCTNTHAPNAERAVRYSDPDLNIRWPFEPTLVSPKDRAAPLLAAAEFDFTFESR